MKCTVIGMLSIVLKLICILKVTLWGPCSADKSICHTTLMLLVQSRRIHRGRRELTPVCCPLFYTCAPWHVHIYTRIYTHIHIHTRHMHIINTCTILINELKQLSDTLDSVLRIYLRVEGELVFRSGLPCDIAH